VSPEDVDKVWKTSELSSLCDFYVFTSATMVIKQDPHFKGGHLVAKLLLLSSTEEREIKSTYKIE